ncbi:UNVERIFIED_ORG: hypothetical protein ABIC54_004417 [Burkholderia sp. 1263]
MTTTTQIAGEAMTEEQIQEIASRVSSQMAGEYLFTRDLQVRFARALLASKPAVPADLLPNALWTRNGSIDSEWWSFKGYEARKDSADQWVLRKAGEELYRHAYLQVVMAHAERELLAASPASPAQPCGEGAVCSTCNGHGMIGGPSYYSPDEGGEPCPDCNGDAAEQADEAVIRDANRYRWLRNEHFPTADKPPLAQVVWKALDDRHSGQWANMIDGHDLDAAIDGARAKDSK